MRDKEQEVKEANRRYYNIVADVVEKVDGYRFSEVQRCLGDILKRLSEEAGGSALLDLGCGTGLTLRVGKSFFNQVYGVDLSYRMLQEAGSISNGIVCGDITFLPFEEDSFNVVTCIGVLHHLFAHTNMFKEVYRVLKRGGLLYTMQDADSVFIRRFYLPVRIYKHFFGTDKNLLDEKRDVSRELMELAEYHASKGLDTQKLVEELREVGFSKVTTNFYWRSASRHVDFLLRPFHTMGKVPGGIAPFFSILARK